MLSKAILASAAFYSEKYSTLSYKRVDWNLDHFSKAAIGLPLLVFGSFISSSNLLKHLVMIKPFARYLLNS